MGEEGVRTGEAVWRTGWKKLMSTVLTCPSSFTLAALVALPASAVGVAVWEDLGERSDSANGDVGLFGSSSHSSVELLVVVVPDSSSSPKARRVGTGLPDPSRSPRPPSGEASGSAVTGGVEALPGSGKLGGGWGLMKGTERVSEDLSLVMVMEKISGDLRLSGEGRRELALWGVGDTALKYRLPCGVGDLGGLNGGGVRQPVSLGDGEKGWGLVNTCTPRVTLGEGLGDLAGRWECGGLAVTLPITVATLVGGVIRFTRVGEGVEAPLSLDDGLGDLTGGLGDLTAGFGDFTGGLGDLLPGDLDGEVARLGEGLGEIGGLGLSDGESPTDGVLLRGLGFPASRPHGDSPAWSASLGLGLGERGWGTLGELFTFPSTGGASVDDGSGSWSYLQSKDSFTLANPDCSTFFRYVPGFLLSVWLKVTR